MDWIKNSAGEIVTGINIDSFMPKIDDGSAGNILNKLQEQQKFVDAGASSWQEYFGKLQDGQKWQIDFVQNTDLQKASLDDVKVAQDKGRQAAIAHNAALKQQTLGAKATSVALKALSTIGTMIVFTLISEGISKLMNAEAEALEKAQASYEAAVEEVNKLNEREDVALSSAKELSELFSDENWGVESAKRASDIYNEMADRLEDVGGAEDDRIQQLREEARLIRENIGLTEEERLAKAEETRRNALITAGWDKQSSITKVEDEGKAARNNFWSVVEKEFVGAHERWNILDPRNWYPSSGYTYYFSDDVLTRDFYYNIVAKNPTDTTDEIMKIMGKFLYTDDLGYDYISLFDIDNGEKVSEYVVAMDFMKRFEKIQEIDGVSKDPLYNSLLEIYNKLKPTYDEVNIAQAKEPVARAKYDAYDYFNANGFGFNSQDDKDKFVEFLKDKKYSQRVIDQILTELANGGFETVEYWEDIEEIFDGMTVSLSDLEKASDKISNLGSAFKELSDNGYITTKTLGEIQKATGLSNNEWVEYENRLLNAKKGSADFNQVLSELTYKILENEFATIDLTNATEEEISAIENKIAAILRENGVLNASAVAHDWLTKAKAKEKIASMELVEGAELDIAALVSEASACNVAKNAYLELVAKEIIFNRNDLDVSDKVKKLNQIAVAAGIAGISMDDLNSKFYFTSARNEYVEETGGKAIAISSSTPKGVDDLPDFYTEYEYELPDGTKTSSFYEYYLITEMGKLADRIANAQNNITIPNYSGAGGNSGGDNTPDYEDPIDATIDRINLRSSELKQQEEEIQNLIEIAELENDYNKQISSTNDLIDKRNERLTELKTANNELHLKAEDLRNSTPQWNEEEWFDSQGNATEAYINFINSRIDAGASKEEIKAIKDQFEKISKLKEAWIENDEEIAELNKELLEDAEKLNELYSAQHENAIRDIEHARDMALEANPFVDTTSYYKQMQTLYHQEAERLRALDPEKYKEEIQELQKQWWDAQNAIVDWRWENSQRWIDDRNAYNDWELFGDSEIEAWERVVKWLKEEYPNELDKIKEAEQNLFEARKEEFSKSNDFASSYIDSQKTILQSYYDVTNSIAEAQHEINKELETSMTMYEWLDEDTRKLLFNQEDYNALSEELLDIQYEANKLQRQYEKDLSNSTLETVESITSQYQMQYETLMKSYEIAKADLEIAKKKQKLNNVLNERNVRMFINGQWQWVANTEDVINAKSELADAEYAKRVEESGLTQQESINNLTKQQDELTVVIKKFENGVIDLTSAITLVKNALGSIPISLSSIYSNILTSGTSEGGTSIRSYDGVWYDSNTDYMANILNASSEDEVLFYNAARNAKIRGEGLASDEIKILTDAEAIRAWKDANRHADGTRYTPGGLTLMGEEGFEAYIDSNGHLIPINQPTIGNIASGGVVFNTDQMKSLRTLWDMSNLSIGGNQSLLYNTRPQQIDQRHDNRIIINGMTVDSGSSDGQALISALRRYVGNH